MTSPFPFDSREPRGVDDGDYADRKSLDSCRFRQ